LIVGPRYPTMAADPPIETSIVYPSEGVTESATVTKLGAGLYRLESVSMAVESVKFRDIIEADEVGPTLRFRRVAQKSDWRVFDFLLAKDARESEKINRVLERVEKVGGHWERIFGGCLFICLPPEVDWNPTADVVG
jgi:hypothetical protein